MLFSLSVLSLAVLSANAVPNVYKRDSTFNGPAAARGMARAVTPSISTSTVSISSASSTILASTVLLSTSLAISSSVSAQSSSPSSSNAVTTTAPATSATPPPNTAPGTITSGCTQFYTVVSGDICDSIDAKFGLTLAQFISMNPEITGDCTNLILGEAYCVQSAGSSAPPTTTIPTTTPPATATPPPNTAPGTITDGCTQFYTAVSGDICDSIDTRFGLTLTQFISMNPEINAACTNIIAGEAYCVQSNGSSLPAPPPNTAPGTITSGCAEYYTVVSGDICDSVDARFGLTLTQFISMNPEIDTACTDLIVGEAYCVRKQ